MQKTLDFAVTADQFKGCFYVYDTENLTVVTELVLK